MTLTDKHRMPETRCPQCGKLLDAASSPAGPGRAPEPGNISVCIGCATPLMFDSEFNMTALSEADLLQIGAEHPDLVREIAVSVAAIRLSWTVIGKEDPA